MELPSASISTASFFKRLRSCRHIHEVHASLAQTSSPTFVGRGSSTCVDTAMTVSKSPGIA